MPGCQAGQETVPCRVSAKDAHYTWGNECIYGHYCPFNREAGGHGRQSAGRCRPQPAPGEEHTPRYHHAFRAVGPLRTLLSRLRSGYRLTLAGGRSWWPHGGLAAAPSPFTRNGAARLPAPLVTSSAARLPAPVINAAWLPAPLSLTPHGYPHPVPNTAQPGYPHPVPYMYSARTRPEPVHVQCQDQCQYRE